MSVTKNTPNSASTASDSARFSPSPFSPTGTFAYDPELSDPALLFAAEHEEERRVLNILIYFDTSISMRGYFEKNKEAVRNFLRELGTINETSIDAVYKVAFRTFDVSVNPVNDVPVDPEELLSVMPDFGCDGKQTDIPALLNHIDSTFTRGGALVSTSKGNYKTLSIIITDFASTTTPESVRASLDNLTSNQIYTNLNETLVIYCGDPKNRRDAETLVGGKKDNVIAVGDLNGGRVRLEDLLIGSTVNFQGASTHVKKIGEEEGSVGETVKTIIEREESTAKDIFGGTAFGDDSKGMKELDDFLIHTFYPNGK